MSIVNYGAYESDPFDYVVESASATSITEVRAAITSSDASAMLVTGSFVYIVVVESASDTSTMQAASAITRASRRGRNGNGNDYGSPSPSSRLYVSSSSVNDMV